MFAHDYSDTGNGRALTMWNMGHCQHQAVTSHSVAFNGTKGHQRWQATKCSEEGAHGQV